MKTESILRLLDSLYSKRDSFSKEELDSIDTISINRIDYDGDFLEVDFNDLTYFNNLKELMIENCILDAPSMEKICSIVNLKKLTFFNCDIIDDIYTSDIHFGSDELYFINSNIELSHVSGYYEFIFLENMDCSSIDAQGKKLDVSHCEVKNIDNVLTLGFDELVISHDQYEQFKDILPESDKKIYVMEKNGQFVDKDVVING